MPSSRLGPLLVALLLIHTGCAHHKPAAPTSPAVVETTPASGAKRPARDTRRQRLLNIAQQEWEFFGRQLIRLDDSGESIPHVGKWEDDGEQWSNRVNAYWTAVGKPGLDGYDCKQPWSAAFISWMMREAGLDRSEFPPSDSHWGYIGYFTRRGPESGSSFVSHRIAEYTPQVGDLVCATRGNNGFIPVYQQDPASVLTGHTKLHCDLIVERSDGQVAGIGGNVRNSVSKTWYPLDRKGMLKPTERRPWFVVLENRLTH